MKALFGAYFILIVTLQCNENVYVVGFNHVRPKLHWGMCMEEKKLAKEECDIYKLWIQTIHVCKTYVHNNFGTNKDTLHSKS